MAKSEAGGDRLSVSSAARLLGVSVSSLRAWAAAGRVPHERTPGGHRRFDREELRAWLAERGGDLPDHVGNHRGPLVAGRIEARPTAGSLIAAHAEEITDGAVALLAQGSHASRRRTDARISRIRDGVDQLARAVTSGDLAGPLRDAEWHAYRHGAAGMAATQPVGELLATTRATDRVLRREGADTRDLQVVRHAMDRITWRAAAGLAAGRRSRDDAHHSAHEGVHHAA
jgi:excisionase family DNA binding protein